MCLRKTCSFPSILCQHSLRPKKVTKKTTTYLLNLCSKGIQVNEHVDTAVGKRLHTAVMRSIWVDVVDTNRVCAERLHESRVACALRGIDEWIVGNELVCNSCSTNARAQVLASFSFEMVYTVCKI